MDANRVSKSDCLDYKRSVLWLKLNGLVPQYPIRT
jgi:hypothetical protein